MLIRSQDSKSLVDISGMTIIIQEIKDGKFKITAHGNNQPTYATEDLGIYREEKRAIEVLDNISSCYKKYSMLIPSGDCYDYAVFCMPEE